MHNTNLHYIHTNWNNLKTSLTPGTPHPIKALEPWIELTPPGPGYSKAPLHLDTFDLIHQIHTDTTTWLKQAGQTPAAPMPAPLTQLDTLLRIADRKNTTWAHEVNTWAHHTARKLRSHLEGDIAGQTIKSPCPICGTHQSLKVRTIKLATHTEPYIACESGLCQPPEGYCSNFLGNTPVWPINEWPWFAGLLEAQNHHERAA